jgi:DNA-binding protein YbaB
MFNGIKKTAGALAQANKLRSQQQAMTKMLNSVRVTGASKNSKVSVTITGDQKVVDIAIDPSLITFVHENFTSQGKEDTMLSKAIMEAIEDANTKVQQAVVKKMQEEGNLSELMSMMQGLGDM